MAGTQIVDAQSAVALNGLQSTYMTGCQIAHMDIVANACTVVCIIVAAEYAQLRTLADSHLSDVRHQVVGDTVGILAYLSALVCTDGIEVTQDYHIPLLVGLLHVHQHLLQH